MLSIGWSFIFTLANLAVLVFFVRLFLWKPLTNFMRARSLSVQQALDEAARERLRAQELRDEMDGVIRNAALKAESIINEAKQRAETIVEEASVAAKRESDAILQSTRKSLESQEAEARSRLRQELAALTSLAMARVLEGGGKGIESGR